VAKPPSRLHLCGRIDACTRFIASCLHGNTRPELQPEGFPNNHVEKQGRNSFSAPAFRPISIHCKMQAVDGQALEEAFSALQGWSKTSLSLPLARPAILKFFIWKRTPRSHLPALAGTTGWKKRYALASFPKRCPVAPESRKTKRKLPNLLYGQEASHLSSHL
jgi:hypothetical protein